MRRAPYFALALVPLWMLACSSSSTDAASGDDAGGDDAGAGDDGATDDASADGGHKDGGGSDAAKSDSGFDAGFDAMPLACPSPGLPTTACANG